MELPVLSDVAITDLPLYWIRCYEARTRRELLSSFELQRLLAGKMQDIETLGGIFDQSWLRFVRNVQVKVGRAFSPHFFEWQKAEVPENVSKQIVIYGCWNSMSTSFFFVVVLVAHHRQTQLIFVSSKSSLSLSLPFLTSADDRVWLSYSAFPSEASASHKRGTKEEFLFFFFTF